tara:strand:- start:5389 stop:5895 length:507 start_codon:yes stop_codon:yes gene_type:complete
VTNRAIFNRKYTEFQPGDTPVFLVNGGGVTSSSPTSLVNFTAGADLIQGEVVYVSGVYAVPAIAVSGVDSAQHQAVGLTAEAAVQNATVSVNLDDIAVVSAANLTADTQLTPGQYYYLSKSQGQLTAFSTASGTVSAGSGYAALVNLGLAVSTTELHVEIQPPVDLFS